ncbi:MAG: metal-dependent transcriptional regulator [Vicinamibacterales bacterium]|jgi:DtxR family Mn-dependent transcriptional regulator
MLPSQTVENYLKTIHLTEAANRAHATAPEGERALVPMGQLASALGVVPGTATTMVKALAESGLVHYEPYMGVRLTDAGEKLASLVLRRHRLIELFLVKVLGMSWAEVHDEAERLEHAVSERLIDLIDDMLGRPAVDPHGDPIPTAEGTIVQPDYVDLLSAPLNTPLTVVRVVDQGPDFLRFIEDRHLMPGSTVTINSRDDAADAVVVRTDSADTTLGTKAASKVLVRLARVG